MIMDEVINYLDKTYEINHTQLGGVMMQPDGVGLDLFEECTSISNFFSISMEKTTNLVISWLKFNNVLEPKCGWEVVLSGPIELNTKWPTLKIETCLKTFHDLDGEVRIAKEVCDKLKGELNDKYNHILSRSMSFTHLLTFLNEIGYILGPYQDTPIKSRKEQIIIKKKV